MPLGFASPRFGRGFRAGRTCATADSEARTHPGSLLHGPLVPVCSRRCLVARRLAANQRRRFGRNRHNPSTTSGDPAAMGPGTTIRGSNFVVRYGLYRCGRVRVCASRFDGLSVRCHRLVRSRRGLLQRDFRGFGCRMFGCLCGWDDCSVAPSASLCRKRTR